MQRRMAMAIALSASLILVSPSDAFHGARWGWGCGFRGCRSPCVGGYCGYGYPGIGLCYSPGFCSLSSCDWPFAPACGIQGCGNTVATPIVLGPAIVVPSGGVPLWPTAGVTLAHRDPASALAIQRHLSLTEPRSESAPPRIAVRPPAAARPEAKTPADALVRHSSIAARRKAERMLAEADEFFRAQNFHSALQRYKLAASTAPDLAEPQWRQGHALVATRNYELAAKAFRRAIALTEDMSRGGFQLHELYGAAARTKALHLDSLAEWTLSHSSSPDAYFLLGVFLHYDGQAARAEKFFAKAAELAGFSGGYLAGFLAPAEEPATSPAARGESTPVTTPVVLPRAGTEI